MPMTDIRSPTLLYAKGAMMLAVGVLASALLLLRHPSAMTALLLAPLAEALIEASLPKARYGSAPASNRLESAP